MTCQSLNNYNKLVRRVMPHVFHKNRLIILFFLMANKWADEKLRMELIRSKHRQQNSKGFAHVKSRSPATTEIPKLEPEKTMISTLYISSLFISALLHGFIHFNDPLTTNHSQHQPSPLNSGYIHRRQLIGPSNPTASTFNPRIALM